MACAEHLELAVMRDQVLDLRERLGIVQSRGAIGNVARPVSRCLNHRGASVDQVLPCELCWHGTDQYSRVLQPDALGQQVVIDTAACRSLMFSRSGSRKSRLLLSARLQRVGVLTGTTLSTILSPRDCNPWLRTSRICPP